MSLRVVQLLLVTLTVTTLRLDLVKSTCPDQLRLAGASGDRYGRVEVCVNSTWGTVCSNESWDNKDASVVCKQAGFSPYGAISVRGRWTENVLDTFLFSLNCTGNEDSVWECAHDSVSDGTCSRNQDAAVICSEIKFSASDCSDGDVRLVGGSNLFEGTVEVCINRAWGSVCYPSWGVEEGQVVCGQLGHQRLGSTLYSTSPYGPSQGPSFLTNLRCSGSEKSLLDCPSQFVTDELCSSHTQDVGVKCEALCDDGSVRLTSSGNSHFRNYGSVELCIGNNWRAVCTDYWDDQDAAVVCHQLGYSRHGAVANRIAKSNSVWQFATHSLNCLGVETSYEQCSNYESSCTEQQYAAFLYCQYSNMEYSECTTDDLRLVGGSTNALGVVEVCKNNAWVTTCSDYFQNGTNYFNAKVVCRYLGFQNGYGLSGSFTSFSISLRGISLGPYLPYQPQCSGSERNLTECSFANGATFYSCSRYDYTAVSCFDPCDDGSLELVGTSSPLTGIPRVCVDNRWGKVCSNSTKNNELASVICSQLGYSRYGAIATSGMWTDNVYRYNLMGVVCSGNERNILECSHQQVFTYSCSTSQRLSVICPNATKFVSSENCSDGEVRLTGNALSRRGRVEVCRNQAWGSVCYRTSLLTHDARVFCRQAGFYNLGNTYSVLASPSVPPTFNSFGCSSEDEFLDQCSNPIGITTSITSCGNSVIGIQCEDQCEHGKIRYSQSARYGYVELEICIEGIWGTVCDSQWDNIDAGVACKQLGYSPYGALALSSNYYYYDYLPLLMTNVQCNGTENSLVDCQYNSTDVYCSRYNYASIFCQDSETVPANCTDGELDLITHQASNIGVPKLCFNNYWGYICNDNTRWGASETNVFCRELGFQLGGSFSSGYHTSSGLKPFSFEYSCSGSEENLSQCQQYHGFYYRTCRRAVLQLECAVAVTEAQSPCQPDGSLQLYSSGSFNQGILEVCVNGSWGRVCGDNWDISQTQVVCEQLGYSRYGAISTTSHSSGFTAKYSFNCDESDCGYVSSLCTSRNTVNVACQEYTPINSSDCTDYDVRLTGGNGHNTGTVEICVNQYWSTVCRQYFDKEDASVVCSRLGFQRYGTTSNIFTVQQQPFSRMLVNRLRCSGTELDISECKVSFHTEGVYCSNFVAAVGVSCEAACTSGAVRLSGTSQLSLYYGHVEICVENQWNPVCGNFWTEENAMVVCRQLGYSEYGSIPYQQSRYSSSLLAYTQRINCSGTEGALADCSQEYLGPLCTSSQYAFTACSYAAHVAPNSDCSTWDLRVSGKTANVASETIEGRLELCYNGNWFSVQYNYLNRNEYFVNLVCQSLGFGPNSYSLTDARVYPLWYDGDYLLPFPLFLSCGSELTHISDCVRTTSFFINPYSYQVGVRCVPVCKNTDIRLDQSPYLYGRVEVCVNGTWGTICQNGWDDYDSSVACQQLGYSPHGSLVQPNTYQTSSLPVVVGSLNCSGNESSISECLQSNCSSSYDASMICQVRSNTNSFSCPNGTLRIVDGSSHLEGRLEVCLNNVWGSVCGSSWDSNDATVACRELGHQPRGVNLTNSFYGRGEGPPLLALDCTGTEASIFNCRYNKLTSAYSCDDGSLAGIKCEEGSCLDGEIRVRGSSNIMIGRVEVCIQETWRTVCSDQWSEEDARVICHQLGFSTFGAIPLRGHFLVGTSLPVGVYSFNCTGGEQNWTQCNYSVQTQSCYTTASVFCQALTTNGSNCTDGDVRLSGGSSNSEGYVQVCINGVWGSICGFNWDYRDGNVVCRQLGFLPQGSTVNQSVGLRVVNSSTFLSNVRCSGGEETLLDCQHELLGQLCSTSNAAVTCEIPCNYGTIRLTGDSVNQKGRVEVCFAKTWGTVCGSTWGSNQASVACRELGFSPFGAIAVTDAVMLQSPVLPITIFHIECHGNESALSECRITNNDGHDQPQCVGFQAALVCQDSQTNQTNCSDGDIRLVGGAFENEGRVELCLNGAWGTVCDDYWDREDASVVCRQLGFHPEGGVSYSNAHYGQGSGPIYVRSVNCSGNELSLLECPRGSYIQHTCRHSKDASVHCGEVCDHGDIRTAGTNQNSIGVVQICLNNTWRIICSDSWDGMDASVVCRQLGFSPHGALASDDVLINSDLERIAYHTSCEGSEPEILNCSVRMLEDQRTCTNASVVCHVNTNYSDCTSGQVRLSGETVPHHGRVEVCVNNAWGTVCDRNWDAAKGNIVCEQLGYQHTGSVPMYNTSFDTGSLPVLLGGLQCTGNEGSLTECERDDLTLLNCSDNTVAGVQCKVVETLTAPVISQPPTDSSIPIYTSVNLSCIAMGTPTPQHTWFKDGALIQGEMQPFLFIPKVQPSDRGSYKCKAVNPLGEANSEIATLTIPGILQYTSRIELSARPSFDVEEIVQVFTNQEIPGTNTSILYVNVTHFERKSNTAELSLLVTLLYTQDEPSPSQLDAIRTALLKKLQSPPTVNTADPVTRYDGCDAVEYLNYLWPETNLGVTALVSCPCEEYLGTFAGEVRRLCSGTFTEGAIWSSSIDDSSCETLRSDLSRQLCDLAMGLSNRTVENSRLIANITSQFENLTAPHISIVSTVIEQLTEEASANPEVRGNYLKTIDNIQQAQKDAVFESQQEQNSSTRILESLGTFLDTVDTSSLSSNYNNNVTVFSYTTFSLQIQQIAVSSFTGQTFIVALGSFELARNRSEQIDHEDLITVNSVLNTIDSSISNYNKETTASIQIPPSLSDKLMNCYDLNNTSRHSQRLSYSVFLRDSFFQPKNRSQFKVASIVLATRSPCPLENISIQATFKTSTMKMDSKEEVASQCAVYGSDNFGGWDSSGCREVHYANGEVTCECAQLGHFGLLLDLNPKASPPAAAIALSVITYIGLALSLICLAIFILTYLINKKLRSNVHGQVLINMSVSLMALYIAFLLGGLVTKVPALCGIVSALLQYFFLVFFAWTAVESVWLYLKLVAVLGSQSFTSRFMLKAALPAWLLPLLIVVVSVAAGHQYYISHFYCRATEWPFWFGHIFFFVVVYIFNWVMFSIIMVSIYKHNRNMNVMKEKTLAEKAKDITKNLFIAMSLSVVLGLGWGLGLAATSFSVVELTIAFQAIFSIFVGLQGVLIFVLHGIRNKDAREMWKSSGVITRSRTLLSSLKGTSVAYSVRGTDSVAFSTLPRSTLSRGTKIDLSVAPEKSTVEETKCDLSEMKVLSEEENKSQIDLSVAPEKSTVEETECDLSEMKVLSEEESKSQIDLSVAPEKSTVEETKCDSSEMKVLSEEESKSQN